MGVKALQSGEVPLHPVLVVLRLGDGVPPEGDRLQLRAEVEETDRVERLDLVTEINSCQEALDNRQEDRQEINDSF